MIRSFCLHAMLTGVLGLIASIAGFCIFPAEWWLYPLVGFGLAFLVFGLAAEGLEPPVPHRRRGPQLLFLFRYGRYCVTGKDYNPYQTFDYD